MALFGVMVTAALACPAFATQSCAPGTCDGQSVSDQINLMQVKHAVNLGKDRPAETFEDAAEHGEMPDPHEISVDALGWVDRAIRFLDKHVKEQGLWRTAGSKMEAGKLAKTDLDNIPETTSAPTMVTVVVRKLGQQDPLIDQQAFAALLHVGLPQGEGGSFAPNQMVAIKKAIMPPMVKLHSFLELKAFFHHWHRVSEYSDVNGMKPANLFTCVMASLIGAADQELYEPYIIGSNGQVKIKDGQEKKAADDVTAQYRAVVMGLIEVPDRFFGVEN